VEDGQIRIGKAEAVEREKEQETSDYTRSQTGWKDMADERIW